MTGPESERLLAQLTRIADLLEQRLPMPADAHLPQECRERRCSYYQHYLAYGPADLTHDGFHAAEAQGRAHMDGCTRWKRWEQGGDGSCAVCIGYEQRLRA